MPFRKQHLPAWTLAAITPVLTELLSGNIPANVFFLPWVYLVLLIVYGLPVLLIRDLFIKWNLGLPGLFLLGLAYGIFNEGVCAKTLLLDGHVPIDAFDHHTWLGINFPWAALIVPWHAFHAIIFPIALVTLWFPTQARTSWLSSRMFTWTAVLLSVLSAVVFLFGSMIGTSPRYLVFFVAIMALLILLSRRTPYPETFLEPSSPASIAPAFLGLTFYPVFVLGLSMAAGIKSPNLIICVLSVLLITLYYKFLLKKNWISLKPFVLFALGDYLSGALFTGLVMLAKGSAIGVTTELVLIGIFAFSIAKIRKIPLIPSNNPVNSV
jgi:hypothetical protein